MADEWAATTLGAVLELQRGFDLPEPQRRAGGYAVVASTGVVGTHERPMVAAPGVVIGRSGSIGGGQFIVSDFWPLNTTLWVSDFRGNDPRYCYYLLRSIDFSGFNVGSGVPTLNRNHVYPLPVAMPPDLATQRSVARVLSALDDKIELNRRTNETLEAMARALFKSWFVDFDPVRAKAEGRQPPGMDADTANLFPSELVDSDLGLIPKGWSVSPLDSIADFRNGLALQKFRPAEGAPRLPVVKIAQLRTGLPDSGEWARADIDSGCVLDNGDIVFSWSGSLTVRVWTGGKAALNQHLFKVTSDLHPKWFYHRWVLHHLPEFQRIASAKATTMGHIQRQHLTAAGCVVPPGLVLSALNVVFRPLLEKQIALDLEARHLARVRDELLPRLLSGDVQVPS